ncbi:MAG: diaminopimelate dehydrogenase [Ruminococcaceae bacterium]|nr:diaminopimelate dehydrogenase [Oscillospiraceae bacterium]
MKIGIFGYGNLGRGVEKAVLKNNDTELVGIFTRRDPSSISTLTGAPVYSANEVEKFKDIIDVMILCGGSATDLVHQSPSLVSLFHIVDSFDTHAKIPEHFATVNAIAKESGKIGIISCGWDPGMFSLARVYSEAILPDGTDYTFWGPGVSQGHSDAIRRIEGVLDARQYTVPVPSSVELAKSGSRPTLTTREKHTRDCYVVAKEGADLKKIEKEIKEMPNYFADYDTTVTFVSMEELKEKHASLPHGGVVIRSGITSEGNNQTIEYRLNLDSNPEFTGSVLLACARAATRLAAEGVKGAKTILDLPPSALSPKSPEELRAHSL